MSSQPENNKVEAPFIDQLQSMGRKFTSGMGDSQQRRAW
jgi:hypothetical protein